ncbi:MAG: hypothetical protein SGJ27_18660 [Candidatus Melainabacteria bacterium]|nr:hypothetical protein [Candidatus Melainabacteria bacterium]
MSNNPNDPNDPQGEDSFDSDRLPDVKQAKAFAEAQRRKAESFTSFSEGHEAIDKFKILGISNPQLTPKLSRPNAAQGTTSNQSAPSAAQPSTASKQAPPASAQPNSVSNQALPSAAQPSSVFKQGSPGAAQPSALSKQNSPQPELDDQQHTSSTVTRGIMRRPPEDDSFTSFSEGLPTVDKFGIVDPDADRVVPIDVFISESSCKFFANSDETTGATSGPNSDSKIETSTPAVSTQYNSNIGGSKTLSRLVYLFETVPWGETINVELSAKPDFIEYCFDEHEMVLDKNFSDEQKILNFSHQAYHATNRLLTKIYDDEKLDRESFVDLFIWSEVAALVTELNVRKELGITKVTPPKVLCQESSGGTYSVNVEELLKTRGMKTLHDVLFHSMVRGTEDLSLVYVFDKLFDIYEQTYKTEMPIARQYIDLCLLSGLEQDCI